METLDSSYITEQNKIAAGGAWIWLLELATAGSATLYYTNNNALGAPGDYYTTWPTVGGNKYQSVPFAMDDIRETTSGDFPTYKLQIGDVDLSSTLRARVQATGGMTGSTARLMVVHSNHLTLTTPAIDEIAEILSCDLTADAVVFTIGIPSLLGRRFPRDRYIPAFCRHKFGGALCQYVQPSSRRVGSVGGVGISFVAGVAGTKRIQYNTIVAGGLLITKVFQHALPKGAQQGANYVLAADAGFTISGSLYNDGFFLANSYHAVSETYVKVFMEADGARAFVAEPANSSAVLTLGYNGCDHTLEACALRNNTQNFGGSPGIAGGVYG